MSSGTLVNFNHSVLSNHGFGAQLNMLDCKMSSSLSPVAPVNILSECYIGMWDNEMAHPPPTKLETTDIMDLIEPSLCNGGVTPAGGVTGVTGSSSCIEPGSTSPTTIIHHTGDISRHHNNHSDVSSPYTSSSSNSSPSSSSTSSVSSTQYLVSLPLPPLGDPYCPTSTECHNILDDFHGGLEPPFHKLSEASHVFQDGGYDAFISDMSHPSTNTSLANHQTHHHQHLQQPPIPPHSQIHNVAGANPCHDNNNGVLLLDMSNHHPHLHVSGSQCSPGCVCINHQYGLGGDQLNDLCPPPGMLVHGVHHSQAHPQHHHHHHQDYSSTWDDLHCEPGDYSILFRKGESPTTSESISYTDNDSESKSSGGSLSGINEITHVSPPKRKVGRPPKKDKKLKRNEKKTGRLWEFIRDLLKNPKYCPSLVKWENHEEGHFRFVNSEKVAQLWGEIKKNPRMTYEKLSRAMRYYYKSHVFEPVLGRRLVYKFGYNATNWKPINPNFASAHPKMYN